MLCEKQFIYEAFGLLLSQPLIYPSLYYPRISSAKSLSNFLNTLNLVTNVLIKFVLCIISVELAVSSTWKFSYPTSHGVLEISDAGFKSGTIPLDNSPNLSSRKA